MPASNKSRQRSPIWISLKMLSAKSKHRHICAARAAYLLIYSDFIVQQWSGTKYRLLIPSPSGAERFAFEIDDEAWHCYETRSSC